MKVLTEVSVETDILDLVPSFLKSRSQELEALESAVTEKDFDTVAKMAHTIKGISEPYGFPRLGVLARDLEFASKARQVQEMQLYLNQMKTYLSTYT